MICVKKYPTNLFELYLTLSALQMYYQISREQYLISEPYISDSVQRSAYHVREWYSELKILKTHNGLLGNDHLFSAGKSAQSHKIWNTLVDDLVRFDRNNNNHNITMYPLDIKRESTKSPSFNFGSNSSSSAKSFLQNDANSELSNVIKTFDWNPNSNHLIEFGLTTEDSNSNDHFIKDKLLDNSFYDLNLNTAVNMSVEFLKNISPLKTNAFLQNLNSKNGVQHSPFNGSEANQGMDEQESEMADVLYKQDVDLGYTLSSITSPCKISSTTRSNRNEEAEKVEAIQSLKDSELAEILYQQDIDLGYILSTSPNDSKILNVIPSLDDDSTTITDCKALKANEIIAKELTDNANDGWAGIPFKIDNETGEYIRLPLDDLFQDILPLAENSSNSLNCAKIDKLSKPFAGESNSSELLDVSTDDISSLIMQSFWPSSQDPKSNANLSHGNGCRQGICGIADPETKSTDHSCPARMDSRIHEIANLFTPVTGFYGMNPDITPYTPYHANYPSKNNPNILSYASRQHSLHNPHREDTCFQTHFAHNLESAGPLNSSYPNAEIHCIKNFTGNSADLVQTEGFLSSFLNEECIQMMDISGNERSPMCNQDVNLPMGDTNSVAPRAGDKSIDTDSSLCANNITERLDLSCDSAVSSLGSERVPSTSDGEWGEGSDSGQDYHQGNCYGPYDYSSSSRNFATRQMPVAQKKYHMFGKRYFQEQTPENSIIHSTIHFLHSTNSVGESDGIENIIENAAFDDCTEEMLPLSNVKNSSKSTHSNVKSERDKFLSSITRTHEIDHDNVVRHNHTYTLLPNSTVNTRFARHNLECKDILPDGHLTRDEKRARNLNVPISVPDIINLPMDEFNERISKYDLTENQLSLIRDIRRRGKNKVAAQNCRKRKLDQILSLEGEVKEVRRRKEKLHSDRAYIAAEKKRIANKFATLHQHIFQFLRDAEGNPCSPSKYSLQQASDGSIYLLPRDSSKLDPHCHMSILIGTCETNSNGTCRQKRIQQSSVRSNLDEVHTASVQPQINVEHKEN